MAEEKEDTRTIPDQISDALSQALFQSNGANGIIIVMSMKDNSVWTYSGGDLITRMGLVKAVEEKGSDMWAESAVDIGEEDDE
jgi:hypothetical protein